MRNFTTRQYSDGTQAVGSAIGAVLRDLLGFFNAIPRGALKRRMVQVQYVGGLIGSVTNPDQLPFLAAHNSLPTSMAYPSDGYQNEWRVKGADPATIGQFFWSTALWFEKPAILAGVNLFYHTASAVTAEFTNTFAANDILAAVEVDNPWLPEDRRQADVVYRRRNFVAAKQTFGDPYRVAIGAMPGHPQSGLQGICINDEINVPVPARSRVRFYFCAPSGAWSGQYYSWTLTTLEELE